MVVTCDAVGPLMQVLNDRPDHCTSACLTSSVCYQNARSFRSFQLPKRAKAFFDYPWQPGELEALQWANRADTETSNWLIRSIGDGYDGFCLQEHFWCAGDYERVVSHIVSKSALHWTIVGKLSLLLNGMTWAFLCICGRLLEGLACFGVHFGREPEDMLWLSREYQYSFSVYSFISLREVRYFRRQCNQYQSTLLNPFHWGFSLALTFMVFRIVNHSGYVCVTMI